MSFNESLIFRQCDIFSNENSSESVDLTQGVPVIEIRESVFVPYVTITLGVVDTGNTSTDSSSGDSVSLLESIKCQGTEKVLFKVEDHCGNVIDLTQDNALRVATVSTAKQDISKETFVLTLVSKEAFDNTLLKNRCKRNYTGKIFDTANTQASGDINIVQTIIRQDLKSTKSIMGDNTINSLQQMGKNRTPFEMITSLQRLGIPDLPGALGKMAGYLFWQTSTGLQFKSLDKLFDTDGKVIKKFIQNNKVEPGGGNPPGFHGKILKSSFNRTTDALAQFTAGAWATTGKYFNIVNGRVTERNVVEPATSNGVIGGTALPKKNSEYENEPTREVAAVENEGMKATQGDDIEKQVKDDTDQPQYEIQNLLEQSLQAYRQKFNFSLSIVIDGDITLHAGDLVHCEFEELSTKATPVRSPTYSGIYMISDLCHYADRSQTYTGLQLVRDSYGVKT